MISKNGSKLELDPNNTLINIMSFIWDDFYFDDSLGTQFLLNNIIIWEQTSHLDREANRESQLKEVVFYVLVIDTNRASNNRVIECFISFYSYC